MKRPRSLQYEVYATGFTLCFTCTHDFVVKQLGPKASSETFEDGSVDSIDYTVHFRPALSVDDSICLSVRQCGASNDLFRQPVLAAAPDSLTLRDDELEYDTYDTHSVQYTDGARTHVSTLFLTLCNVGVVPPVIRPHVCMRRFMVATHGGRYKGLRWFPPNCDPALYGLRIDPATIPQRTPLWFKLRGAVSGSKAYKLLGFFVPTLAENPTWNMNDERFGDAARSAMRLGSASEDACALTYLRAFPRRSFAEVGWCDAPRPPAYPLGWGASPDGVVHDPDATWPAGMAPLEGIEDVTRGGLEFKCSRTRVGCEAYYLPQLYMEMIALRVAWCDLMRYRPPSSGTVPGGASLYRFWRDLALEAALVALWKRAVPLNSQELQRVVHTDPEFIAMRRTLSDMAYYADPYVEIGDEEVRAARVEYDAAK